MIIRLEELPTVCRGEFGPFSRWESHYTRTGGAVKSNFQPTAISARGASHTNSPPLNRRHPHAAPAPHPSITRVTLTGT